MEDEWEVVGEEPLGGQPQGAPRINWEGAPAPQAQADDGWEVAFETPTAPPKDTRRRGLEGEALGFTKGAAEFYDSLMGRVASIPGVEKLAQAPGINPIRGLLGTKRLLREEGLPKIREWEKTTRPGGIGSFAGETVAALPFGGPIAQGVVGGLADSDVKEGDWSPEALKQLAWDATVGGVTAKIGDVIGQKTVKGVTDRILKGKTRFKPEVEIPKLQQAKTEAYQRVKDLGATYTPKAGYRLVGDLDTLFKDFSANKARHGPAYTVAQTIKANMRSPGGRTLDNIDQLRQVIFRDVANSTDPAVAELGSRMAKTLDNWLDNTTFSDIRLPGGMKAQTQGARLQMAAAAKTALADARKANIRYRNVELIDRKLRSAETRTKTTYAGGNIDNRIRQTLRPLMDPDSRRNIGRFIGDEAMEQLTKTVEGTPGQNFARAVGHLSPFAGGLKFLTSLGAAGTTGGHSLWLNAAGLIGKHISDKTTRKNVSTLMEMIAAGGKTAMLAERQMKALAARNSQVGQWLTAIEKDAGEWTGNLARQAESDVRNSMRERRDRDYEAQRAAAGGR